jgi:hypothetical protein
MTPADTRIVGEPGSRAGNEEQVRRDNGRTLQTQMRRAGLDLTAEQACRLAERIDLDAIHPQRGEPRYLREYRARLKRSVSLRASRLPEALKRAQRKAAEELWAEIDDEVWTKPMPDLSE